MRVARRAVKAASAAADRWRPAASGVVVLLYHRVGGGSALEIDLDAARFDEQIAMVAASGRALALGDALERLAAPKADAESSIVVTFDDGTADFADVALPILVRHQVPATLYVATDFVEGGTSSPRAGGRSRGRALRRRAQAGSSTSDRTPTRTASSTGSRPPRPPTSSTGRST